CQMYINSPFTF
nr:immunoglobulin light chain junction region [Macaca mulatta]MOW07889.1 immunoglobulin light chain junction region [Macaca mulatta]MOW07916.1 immunoglobulin light chain junction region [Macaca mulatta]MOW07977.1 immunoglobulin light chain junction region [Macaca mulatta]MOW07986.1 immunoglobulin light chain junction region [Macaca mulatta]